MQKEPELWQPGAATNTHGVHGGRQAARGTIVFFFQGCLRLLFFWDLNLPSGDSLRDFSGSPPIHGAPNARARTKDLLYPSGEVLCHRLELRKKKNHKPAQTLKAPDFGVL